MARWGTSLVAAKASTCWGNAQANPSAATRASPRNTPIILKASLYLNPAKPAGSRFLTPTGALDKGPVVAKTLNHACRMAVFAQWSEELQETVERQHGRRD